MIEMPVRATEWNRVSENPRIEIREVRPQVHAPLECDRYDPVYKPMKVEYEGACRNFKVDSLYCVFCGSCLMSNALFKIPYDVRDRCDRIMGW